MKISGHVLVNGEKVKVLLLTSRTSHCLKLRTSGKDGNLLEDESSWLTDDKEAFLRLKSGESLGGKIPSF